MGGPGTKSEMLRRPAHRVFHVFHPSAVFDHIAAGNTAMKRRRDERIPFFVDLSMKKNTVGSDGKKRKRQATSCVTCFTLGSRLF